MDNSIVMAAIKARIETFTPEELGALLGAFSGTHPGTLTLTRTPIPSVAKAPRPKLAKGNGKAHAAAALDHPHMDEAGDLVADSLRKLSKGSDVGAVALDVICKDSGVAADVAKIIIHTMVKNGQARILGRGRGTKYGPAKG